MEPIVASIIILFICVSSFFRPTFFFAFRFTENCFDFYLTFFCITYLSCNFEDLIRASRLFLGRSTGSSDLMYENVLMSSYSLKFEDVIDRMFYFLFPSSKTVCSIVVTSSTSGCKALAVSFCSIRMSGFDELLARSFELDFFFFCCFESLFLTTSCLLRSLMLVNAESSSPRISFSGVDPPHGLVFVPSEMYSLLP